MKSVNTTPICSRPRTHPLLKCAPFKCKRDILQSSDCSLPSISGQTSLKRTGTLVSYAVRHHGEAPTLNPSHESQKAFFSTYFSMEDGRDGEAGMKTLSKAMASVEDRSESQRLREKLREAERLATLRTEQLMRVQSEAQKAKKAFEIKLRKMYEALEAQQNIFSKQMALQQALSKEQLEAQLLESEAAAKSAESRAMEAEMKLSVATQRLVEAEIRASSSWGSPGSSGEEEGVEMLDPVIGVEGVSSANPAQLQMQLKTAEATIEELEVEWRSEVEELKTVHVKEVAAMRKEYVEAVEGFEWLIRELEAEKQLLKAQLLIKEE